MLEDIRKALLESVDLKRGLAPLDLEPINLIQGISLDVDLEILAKLHIVTYVELGTLLFNVVKSHPIASYQMLLAIEIKNLMQAFLPKFGHIYNLLFL
jgi:hypothetical protein